MKNAYTNFYSPENRAQLAAKTKELEAAKARVTELEAELAATKPDVPPMRQGFVIMLDALGFKGIWNRQKGGAEAVLARMKRMRDEVMDMRGDGQPRATPHPRISCECISDTIAIGVSYDPGEVPKEILPRPDQQSGLSMNVAAKVASIACTLGLDDDAPLVYRGCITYGGFEMDGGFVVGPAIDEAAEHMEQAEGALVWCLPSALKNMQMFTPTPGDGLCDFTVPLKGARFFETKCVIPLGVAEDEERTKKFLATFDTTRGLDVAIKKQHTRRFLEVAKQALEATRGRVVMTEPPRV